MSMTTVPQVRPAGKSTTRPALRLVPTPPAAPPQRPPFYPIPNSLSPYLSVLRNSAVKLYCYLKRHANRRVEPEYCDRGYDTMARDLVLSRRMVIYAERELERYGLLTRHAWQGRYQGKRANRYTFPTPTGQPPARPPRTRRKRPPAAVSATDQGVAKSATDCTSTPVADDQPKVQQIASVKVQHVAPIQEYKHKNRAKDEGRRSNLGVGEAPPSVETSTTEATPETLAADWHAPTLPGRARELFDLYQAIGEPAGLQHETYTVDLEHDIIACLRKYGDYGLWQQALHLMATIPYFTSRKARGWEDHLHWLVTKDHVYRVINGHYGEASQQPVPAQAPKKCAINGCDAPQCPHEQQCARHACCEACAREKDITP
jgi:hypothetical protein